MHGKAFRKKRITAGKTRFVYCACSKNKEETDMDMQSGGYSEFLKKAVEDGRVSRKTLDEAVRRVLTVKARLGLFEDPYKYCSKEREAAETLTQENRIAARTLTEESCVLLKNDFNPKAISKLMGHAKEIITIDVYGDKRGIIADCVDELRPFIEEMMDEEDAEAIDTMDEELKPDIDEYLP